MTIRHNLQRTGLFPDDIEDLAFAVFEPNAPAPVGSLKYTVDDFEVAVVDLVWCFCVGGRDRRVSPFRQMSPSLAV